MHVGAVKVVAGIPTTSSKPRYFLQKEFAELFDPQLTEPFFFQKADIWRERYLSPSGLIRTRLAKAALPSDNYTLHVEFPNGERRALPNGPSEQISKSVIEVFAKHFLGQPVMLWLSTSDSKVVTRDSEMAKSIGLDIQVDKNLPDIILVDLLPERPLIVFVEVVASDGPMSERRQNELLKLTDAGKIERSQVAFITAYLDRADGAFIKTSKSLAWNSFVWFVTEPDKIMVLRSGELISKLIAI